MDEGRESVVIAIPFTAGVAAASYSLKLCYVSSQAIGVSGSICVCTAVGLGIATLSPCRRHDCSPSRHGPLSIRTLLLILTFLAAGAAAAFTSYIPSLEQTAVASQGFLEKCSMSLKRLIDDIPVGDSAMNALMKAFLTGDQSDLTADVKSAFRDSGASHLLALSGMHLSIIYLVVSKMLSVLGNSPMVKNVRSAVIIAGSGFFTLLTGAVPSLVRAFYFILLREAAMIAGRKIDNIHVFNMALLLQLALSPQSVTSVGFQLSYLAMLGIFTLYNPIDRIWDKAVSFFDSDGGKKEAGRNFMSTAMRQIWSMCALSIACQITAAPVVYLYFGTFPQYFLITNLLCIPLSNAIMVVSLIILPLHAIGICPRFLTEADGLMLQALTDILSVISGM